VFNTLSKVRNFPFGPLFLFPPPFAFLTASEKEYLVPTFSFFFRVFYNPTAWTVSSFQRGVRRIHARPLALSHKSPCGTPLPFFLPPRMKPITHINSQSPLFPPPPACVFPHSLMDIYADRSQMACSISRVAPPRPEVCSSDFSLT